MCEGLVLACRNRRRAEVSLSTTRMVCTVIVSGDESFHCEAGFHRGGGCWPVSHGRGVEGKRGSLSIRLVFGRKRLGFGNAR